MADNEAAAVDELHRRVGRNLLLFQRIEQCLRFVLPYSHPDGARQSADAKRAYQARLDQSTLGQLAKEFKESVTGSTELIESSLASVIAARNDLIHHFYRNKQFSFLDEGWLKDALAYLDEQHSNARAWDKLSGALVVALLTILIDQNDEHTAEFQQYRDRIAALLPDWMETIKP